jgi:tetratricopeptide (TPR) repeat protein
VEELGRMGLEKIVDQLTKTCDSFRSMFIDKSSTTFTFDDVSKAENQILNQNDVIIDTIELARAYLTINDIAKSLSLLDEFTAKNPKADFAYWMKSFCYYKSNNTNKAVDTIDKVIELSGNENMIQFLKIYRNVLMPKLIDENDEITLTISKDKKLIE